MRHDTTPPRQRIVRHGVWVNDRHFGGLCRGDDAADHRFCEACKRLICNGRSCFCGKTWEELT